MTATQTPVQSLAARRHLAYRYLLKKCLRLTDRHLRDLMKEWNMTRSQVRRAGFRSAPQHKYHLMFLNPAMESYIDLRGIAGFYFDCNRWRFNSPSPKCILRPFKDSNNLIQGILVYRNARDMDPFLLSSSGLLLGSRAINFNALLHH